MHALMPLKLLIYMKDRYTVEINFDKSSNKDFSDEEKKEVICVKNT